LPLTDDYSDNDSYVDFRRGDSRAQSRMTDPEFYNGGGFSAKSGVNRSYSNNNNSESTYRRSNMNNGYDDGYNIRGRNDYGDDYNQQQQPYGGNNNSNNRGPRKFVPPPENEYYTDETPGFGRRSTKYSTAAAAAAANSNPGSNNGSRNNTYNRRASSQPGGLRRKSYDRDEHYESKDYRNDNYNSNSMRRGKSEERGYNSYNRPNNKNDFNDYDSMTNSLPRRGNANGNMGGGMPPRPPRNASLDRNKALASLRNQNQSRDSYNDYNGSRGRPTNSNFDSLNRSVSNDGSMGRFARPGGGPAPPPVTVNTASRTEGGGGTPPKSPKKEPKVRCKTCGEKMLLSASYTHICDGIGVGSLSKPNGGGNSSNNNTLNSNTTRDGTQDRKMGGGGAGADAPAAGKKMKVVKRYNPQLDDEVFLEVDDVVEIEEAFEDGWGVGVNCK
jgi:hypothetical protein